jgi:uncharacterized protein involved in response to NO
MNPASRPQPDPTPLHTRFILVGLVLSILGGFTLAIALPAEAALGIGARGWVAHAQVHGHLQVVGFVALVVVGVTYHLLPTFGGTPIAHPRLTAPSLTLIAAGVVARVVGQPLADHLPFAVLMAAGAWAELLGSLCFATVVTATLRGALRRGEATPPFFIAGATWLAVQAALGAWWVTVAAVHGMTALDGTRDGALVTLQLSGFALLFILGVGVRSFPVFFAARRIVFHDVVLPFAAWQVGLGCIAVAGVTVEVDPTWAWRPAIVGLALAGLGSTWIAMRTGWWRRPSRMRPASRPFALPLQMALAWLTLAGALSVGMAVVAIASGEAAPAFRLDAIRHILAVGVVLTTIVAMAQLVLPEFASERFAGRQGAWRGIALGGLLALATTLRAGSRWWSDALPAGEVDIAMSVAGMLAMGVMATFAALYVRGVRNHRALLARFAAMGDSGRTWELTTVDRPQERRSP